MPNLYATPQEIKTASPEMIPMSSDTSQDSALHQLCERVSRLIDRYCNRVFYPYSEQRVFSLVDGAEIVRIDDAVSITTVEISRDEGASYLASSDFGSSDYYTARYDALVDDMVRINPLSSYDALVINKNGAVGAFPSGQRSLRVDAVWGFADNRLDAWEDSTDTVESNPLSSSETSVTVNDADGAGLWGVTPRFQAGQINRCESEFWEVTGTNTSTDVLTVVRARNGSTGAQHAQNKQIDIWRPPAPVKQAAIITAVRSLMRAKQNYQDAGANVEMGQMFYVSDIDPEAAVLLKPYRKKWSAG